MTRIKFFALFALLFVFAALFTSCNGDLFGSKEPTDIKISSTLMEFDTIAELQGKNLQLSAEITMKDGSTSTDVRWTVPEDPSAFKVYATARGVLTFQILKAGTYVVHAGAVYNDEIVKTAQCVITIKDALTGLGIAKVGDSEFDSTTLTVGSTLDLMTVYTPSSTSQTGVRWSVDNNDIISVTEQPNGRAIITGKAAGTAVLTVRSVDNQKISDKVTILVQESGAGQKFGVRSIEVTPGTGEIEVGKSLTLSAKVLDGNANEITTGTVSFSIDGAGATVSSSGRNAVVTAVKGGEVTLHASFTYDGATVTADVPIMITGDVDDMAVSSSFINSQVGDTETIDILYSPEDTARKGFSYSVSNQNVILVTGQTDSSLTFRTISEGRATITLTSKYNSAIKTSVIVNGVTEITEADRIQKVTLSSNALSYYPPFTGGEIEASVYRRADNGAVSISETNTVLWTSSDETVIRITVDEDNPNLVHLTQVAPGKATVTATSKDNMEVSSSAVITVLGTLESIIPSSTTINVPVGGMDVITLTPYPSYAVYSKPVISTSNDGILTDVGLRGTNIWGLDVTGLRSGTTTATVYVDGRKMATVNINVYLADAAAVRNIELSETSVSLAQDADPYFLSASALDRDGIIVEKQVEFAPASDIALQVASIERIGESNDFYIVPLNAGSADYLFTVDGNTYASTRLHIEVGGGAVQGETAARQIRPQADSVSIQKGNTAVMKLNVIPLGADAGNITWTVSDMSVASVTGNGLECTVWGISSGKARVTATSDSGLATSFNVTVTESASVKDTRVSYISLAAGSETSHLVTSSLRRSITVSARSYSADGNPIQDTYTWSVEGDAVQAVQTNGATDQFSVITKQYTGMENPAIVKATSDSNPDVYAEFRIYVSADTTVSAENPQVLPEVAGVTLETGATKTYSYRVLPVTYYGEFSASMSSDAASAVVDSENKTVTVTALHAGSSVITLSDGKASAQIRVTVVDKAQIIDSTITGISLDRSYLSYDLAQKSPQTISATVYRNGIASRDEKITWTVDDESLASLTINGAKATVAVKGVTGITTITATATENPDVSASCYVEIIDSTALAQRLRYVMLSESSVSMKTGESLTLTVSGQPAEALKTAEIRWASSDESVAVVSNGRIRAVSEGLTEITVTAEGLTDTCRVYVSDDTVSSLTPRNIVLSETLMNVSQENMDRVYTVRADVLSATGSYITDRSVIWSVEDQNGAIEWNTAYNSFSFSPRNAGTAIVTATMDNVTAQVKIVVGSAYAASDSLKSIKLYPSKLTLEIGDTAEVKALTVPSDSQDNLSWAVSTPATVQITPSGRTAEIKGIKAGISTVTVYSIENPDISAQMQVDVRDQGTIAAGEVTGITLDRSSVTLDMNERALTTIKATVYKDGKASDGEVIWTYTQEAAAAIDAWNMGNNTISLTKKAVGSGYITATSKDDDSFEVSCYVEVIDSATIVSRTLLNAMLSSTSVSLEEGDSYQINLVTIPAELEGVEIAYASTNEGVARVSRTGLVTAVAQGRADIRVVVSHGTKIMNLTCSVSVYRQDEAIQIQPSAVRFSENAVYLSQDDMDTAKTVTATVLDSSFQEIDGALVYWEIDNPAVAHIEKNGNSVDIFPLSAGRANVKATYRNVSNTLLVVVGSPSSALTFRTTAVSFDTSSAIMSVGETKTVKANLIPAGVEDRVAYTVDDASVLALTRNEDGSLGLEALKAGSAVITATSVSYPSIRSTMNVTVRETTAGIITSIELDKHFISLTIGEKSLTELKATAYVDGKAAKNVNLSWSLEGLTDAQLGLTKSDSYGSSVYLTKKAAGEGFIVVSSPDGSVSARCQVEITEIQQSPDTVKYIRLSETLMNLSQEKMDKTYTITAGAYTADNRLLSRQVAWTVDDPDGVLAWEAGANTIAVSPRNAGTAVITATVENVEAKTRVIVGTMTADTSASSLSVSPATLQLSVGQEHTVSAAVLPVSDGNSVLWTTSAPGIAAVEPDGNNATVRGVSAGSALITAQVVGTELSKTIAVKVSNVLPADAVSSVSLDKTSITFDLAEKDLTTLKATVLKGSGAVSGQVDWSMDESLQGIVSYTEIGNNIIGLTKGNATGSGYITATSHDDPDFYASCFVQVIDSTTVSPDTLLAANLSSTTVSVGSGDTYQFSVQVLPEALEGYSVYWLSSDESVARISETGKLTAVAPGRTTVTANVVKDGRVITLSCGVSVYANVSDAVTPAAITFSDNVIYLSQDDMDKGTEVKAKILDSSYNEMKFTEVDSWSVEQDGNIVSVLTNGNSAVVYPLSAGKAVITATYKNVENSFMVIVGTPSGAVGTSVRNIMFSTSSVIVGKGETEEITAYVVPSGADSSVAFATDNPRVISASGDGNKVSVTGVAAGSANIRAISLADPSVASTMRVTVVEDTGNSVTSIVLDKSHIALSIDDRALTQVKATAYSGDRVVDADITWTLEGLDESQLGIVTLDTHASRVSLVKRSAGNGYLVASAEDGTVYAKCLVEITGSDGMAGIPSRIIMSQDMLYLSQEHMDEYTMVSASVVDIAGRSLDNTVTWTISDPNVVKVAVNGNRAMVYPLSGGVARLTATSGSASNSVMIVVGAAYLSDGVTSAVLLSSNKVLVPVGSSIRVRGSIIPVSSSESSVIWTGGTPGTAEITAVNGNSVTISGLSAGNASFVASNANGSAVSELQVIVLDPADIGPDDVTYVTLDKSSVTLDISERTSTVIKATAGKGDGSQDGEVDWVADPSLTGVITMTDMGNNTVSLVKTGTGSGYVTAKSKTDPTFVSSVYVEVIDSATSGASLKFINLSEHLSALQVGEKTVLTVSGYPASQFAGKTVVWGTSDAGVAAVSSGTVYATGAGTATITATIEGTDISDSCTVNVYTDEIGVLAIRMDANHLTMSVNEMTELGYTVVPSGASEHLIWSSSDRNVVQVSRTGVVTAKAPGTASVTVYDYVTGAFSSVDIEVLSTAVTGSVTGINVNPSSLTMRRLSSVRLRVYALPDNMTDSFTYGISDESVAIIDEERSDDTSVVLTGLKVGTATLTVTSVSNPAVSRDVKITVVTDISDVVTAVTPSRTSVSMVVGGLTEVSAKVFVDNKATTGKKLNWSTEGFADGVVTVTPVDSFGTAAQISALQTGSGYVMATVDEGTEFARIFVDIKPQTPVGQVIEVSTVTLSDNTIYLSQESGRSEVSAVIRATDGSVLAGPVVWSTTDESIFTVEYAGNTAVLTPQSAGTAKLHATFGDVSAEAVVFVGSPTIAEAASMSEVHINPSRLIIAAGAQETLVATVEPAGTPDSLSWAVSNPTVISLEQNGRSAVITGLASGTATVTAYASENARVMDTTEITVKPYVSADEVTGVKLSRSSVSLDLAERTDVSVSATVFKGGKTSEGAVAWTMDASLENVVDMRVAGNAISLVKKAVGSGYITATSIDDPDFFAVLYVEVTDSATHGELRSAMLSASSMTLIIDQSATVSVETIPVGVEGVSTTWSSDNTQIATVEDGMVTGVSEGTTTIRALIRKNGTAIEKTLSVRVASSISNVPSGVTLSKSVVRMTQGSQGEEITASVKGTLGPIEGTVTFESSQPSVFTVAAANNTAVLFPVSAGVAELSATYGSVTSKALVIVGSDAMAELGLTSIVLNPNSFVLTPDTTAQINASLLPAGVDAEISWSSADTSVATVAGDGLSATVTAVATGSTTITAYNGAVRQTATVLVKDSLSPTEITSVGISRTSVSMDISETSPVTVTATVFKNRTASSGTVAWTMDESLLDVIDMQIAGNTVSLKAKGVGSGYIRATSTENSDFFAICHVQVSNSHDAPATAALRGITLSTASVTITKGSQHTIEVSTIPENVSDVEMTWSVGDATIISVDNGTVTGLGVGSTYVRLVASKGSSMFERTVSVKVTESGTALTDFILSDQSLVLRLNESYTVKATMVPEGAEGELSWASSDISVARVSQNGTITGVGEGNAIISVHNYANDIHKAVNVQVLGTPAQDARASFIRLSVQSVELSQTGGSKDVTASVIANDGYPLAGAVVTWAMDKEGVASMVTEGNTATLSALDSGRTTLRAYYGNLSASASVYTGVVPGMDVTTLDHITATPSVLTLQTGSEGSISLSTYPAGLEISPVWQSADTTIATVASSFNGQTEATVKAVKQGNTTITARDTGTEKTASVSIRVRDDISTVVTGITTDRTSLTLDVNNGSGANVSAAVYVANNVSTTEPLTWAFLSEDMTPATGVVTFTPTDASKRTVTVRPLATGSGYLKVSATNDPDVYALVYVKVMDSTAIAAEVTELRLEFDAISMAKGTTRRFNAITLPAGAAADVRWSVENQSASGVASVDIYGNVTALAAGTADIKAYIASKPSISDTVSLTVTESQQGSGDTPSAYDIGSVTISPATATLSQEADYPTAFTARVFDKSGRELKTENVVWNTDSLNDVATVVRTEGNVIYLEAKSAGKGTLVAQKTSKDNTVVTATAFISTGAVQEIAEAEEPVLTSFAFGSSSPIYLVADKHETRIVSLQYRPDVQAVKGAVWTYTGAEGFIQTTTTDSAVAITALAATTTNAQITATSTAKDAEGHSKTATLGVKVVATEADLPEVTTLVLDRSAVILNLAEKADTIVRATAYDHSGKEISSAVITWELRDNDGTNVTLTTTSGRSVGINKGNRTGSVSLVAVCGEIEAVCSVTIIDSVEFGGIALSTDNIHLVEGATTQITVFGNPESLFTGEVAFAKGGNVDSIEVTATSDRTRFIVTAVEEGTATIRFSTVVNGKTYTADATIFVNSVETLGVNRITLTPASAYLEKNGTVQLTARLYDRKGNTATVTAVKEGQTMIIARAGEIEAVTFISVGADPAGDGTLKAIIPGMTMVSMAKNDRFSINVATVPSDFSGTLSAVSNRENVVTAFVSGRTLTLGAVGPGSAVVTLSIGQITATVDVTVSGESIPATIRFNKNAISLTQEPGAYETVIASVYDTSDVKLATVVEDWTVDDASIATITDNGNGSVTVEPLNAGVTTVTARVGSVASSFRVSVNEKTSTATGPSKIVLDTPSLRLRKDETALVGALYQPAGLSDEAKSVTWTTSDANVATVTAFGTEQAVIEGKGAGSATITATSRTGNNVSASMTVTVPDDSVAETTDTYLISLDKTNVRMDKASRVMLSATLYRNGEQIDASNVDWSFENNDSPKLLDYIVPAGTASTAKAGTVSILSASNKTGFAYVVASYNGATARAQVEVADLNVIEDTGLRSIVFSSSTMLMEVGEQATFTTSILPAVTGVSYTWTQMEKKPNGSLANVDSNPLVRFISTKDGSVTLEALREGKAVITVSAQIEDYTPVTATVTIEIVAEGAAEAVYNYSAMKLSTSSLTLGQNADATYITATLVDENGNETTDAISGWRLLHETGKVMLSYDVYDENGAKRTSPYWTYAETRKASYAELLHQHQANFQDLTIMIGSKTEVLFASDGTLASVARDFSVVGDDYRMLRFVPGKAGLYFIEAFGPSENGSEAVKARAIVYVTGSISDASFSSSYVHMIKGDNQLLTVSLSPSTSSIKSAKWTLSDKTDDDGFENPYLTLDEAGDRTVVVNARNMEGTSTLTYTVTDVNGNSVSTSTTIVVHDPSYGTGGIRNIAFPNQFESLGYPYTARTYKASAYYMDGSKAEDQDIVYNVQVSVDGTWKNIPAGATEIWSAYTGTGESWSTKAEGAALIATYSQGNGGITVIPQHKGVFRIVSSLHRDSQDFTSEMYVTVGGDSNRITPSSSSVVLYTGGSAEISFSLDNPGYNGKLSWQILSETTSDGYLIEDDKIVATGEAMRSVFKSTSGTIEGKSLALGARILAANATIANALHESNLDLADADILGNTSESMKRERIVETFPRSAVLRVSTADNQSGVDINVTIRRLPEANTYPVAIKLSAAKVDLNPPFNTEQTITASLMDQNGKETAGTIEWYLYPIGTSDWETAKKGAATDSPKMYLLDKDQHVIENDYADYYFSGETMYYTPKKAGIYRLTVKCTQNPQLQYTSTLNVAGDVTGISASTGATLQVAKNNSTEISAVFEPASALARTVYFGLDNASGTVIVPSGGNLSNEYIRVSMVGTSSSVTVTGLQGTTGASIQKIRLVYPATSKDETAMTNAVSTAGGLDSCYLKVEGNGLNGTVTYSVYKTSDNTKVGSSFNAYSYSVEVSVTVDKAIYSFTTTSNRSIDPSSLESGRISFDMVATATSEGGSSVSPFSHWDWVEMQIVGDESGEVYASSVPVDAEGRSLYYVDGNGNPKAATGLEWRYYQDGHWVSTGNTSATYNGKYYNHQTRSFTLNDYSTSVTNKVLVSGGTAYRINKSYEKVALPAVNVSEIKSITSDGTEDSTGTVTVHVGSIPLAIKSGNASGMLDTDNGGSTWFFTLNTDAIGDETLRIRVRLRDDIAHGPVVAGGYDEESMQVNESNLSLTIGGKITSLSTGMVIRENHGGTASQTLEAGIEQIKLYEGASVTLIPTFNPSNTHQKGLEWTVTKSDGDPMPGDWAAISSTNGAQLMLTANAFNVISEDHRVVMVTARSTADPSVFCRYEVDIQTLVKSLQFTAISQKQTNKTVQSGVSASPVYVNIAVDQSPITEGTGDIYCFDTTDVSGGGGNVDAYYITYTPVPDYGYDFELEIVNNKVKGSNQVIGEIETLNTGTDNTPSSSSDGTGSKKSRAFRFVPTGRVYSQYKDNGEGDGDYTVAYGDVTVRIKNTSINYSKEFTIHYQPAGFRLVEYIEEINNDIRNHQGHLAWDFLPEVSGEGVSSGTKDKIDDNWDIYWNETEKVQTLKGIECLVFHPNEEAFPLTMAGTYILSFLETVGNTSNKTYIRYYDNPKSISPLGPNGEILNTSNFSGLEIKWTLSSNKTGTEGTDLVKFADKNGNSINGRTYETGGNSGKDNHIYLKAQSGTGVAYLSYEIRYPLFDKDGKIITSITEDEHGELVHTPQYVTMNGGIPIYVISEVDPEMVKIAQTSLQARSTGLGMTYLCSLIPESITRAQIEKWYGISTSYNINNSDGEVIQGKYLFRGKTYAIFDGSGTPIDVGTRTVTRLDDVYTVIKNNAPETDWKIPINLSVSGLCSIPAIPSTLLDSNFMPSNPHMGLTSSYDYTKRDNSYLWTRGYRSLNLYSMEDMTWLRSLNIDMSTLTPGSSYESGVSLSDLLTVSNRETGNDAQPYAGMTAGDFSKANLESITIKGKGTSLEEMGIGAMKIPNGCALELSNVEFASGTNTISCGSN